jgi:hypothetical protein
MQTSRSPPNDKGRLRTVAKPYVTVYGYARVSTDGQSAQVRQLRAAGAGKVFPRPAGTIHPRPVEHPRRDHQQEKPDSGR